MGHEETHAPHQIAFREAGNPKCASYDARNCLWGKQMNQSTSVRFDHSFAVNHIARCGASPATKTPNIGAICCVRLWSSSTKTTTSREFGEHFQDERRNASFIVQLRIS
jgi:hypothetical protein